MSTFIYGLLKEGRGQTKWCWRTYECGAPVEVTADSQGIMSMICMSCGRYAIHHKSIDDEGHVCYQISEPDKWSEILEIMDT